LSHTDIPVALIVGASLVWSGDISAVSGTTLPHHHTSDNQRRDNTDKLMMDNDFMVI
jgi:hypothetical protein